MSFVKFLIEIYGKELGIGYKTNQTKLANNQFPVPVRRDFVRAANGVEPGGLVPNSQFLAMIIFIRKYNYYSKELRLVLQ